MGANVFVDAIGSFYLPIALGACNLILHVLRFLNSPSDLLLIPLDDDCWAPYIISLNPGLIGLCTTSESTSTTSSSMENSNSHDAPTRDFASQRQSSFLAATITLTIAVVLSLVLRLYARRMMKAGFYYDDYCSILACLFSLAQMATLGVAVYFGLGLPINQMPDGAGSLTNILKSIMANQLTYTTAMTLTKLSLTIYFKRLFPTPKCRLLCNATMVYLIGWFLAFVFSILFQCTPVTRFWNPMESGFCVNQKAFYIANGFTAFASDLFLIAIPVSMIWPLQIRTLQKYLLSGVFALGLFACAISIIRLVLVIPLEFSFDSPTASWDWYTIDVWSTSEASVCYICSCCPAFGPYFRRTKRPGTTTSISVIQGSSWKSQSLSPKKSSSEADIDLTDHSPGIQREDRFDVESCGVGESNENL